LLVNIKWILVTAGFWELHSKYGKLPWARLFQPAINLASGGFKVPATLAAIARSPGYEFLVHDPTFKAVFAPNGTLLGEGDMMYRPTYAQTLDTIVNTGKIELTEGHVRCWRVLRRAYCP
jgi:gamma-glutamyltranspeptidase / glutathione hydrolase / leukotriene-C4 hydrolase